VKASFLFVEFESFLKTYVHLY